MILVQIATALTIGAYVVLSKDGQPKRLDANPRESLPLQQPARAAFPFKAAVSLRRAAVIICRLVLPS